MTLPRLIMAAAAAVLLAACAQPQKAAAPDTTVYVLRHLHTPGGQRDPDLLPEGRAAAEALAARLAPERPKALYVSPYRRSEQSVAPLAARLGLTPIVYDPRDTAALVRQVRAGPSPAVVVGHSNTVPGIVAAFGGEQPGPLAHEDFGDLWRIGPGGDTARSRLP